MATEVPTVVPPRHLYKVPEAMRLLSMGRSAIYEQMRAGRLKFVKQGRATLIPAVAIAWYVEMLMNESEVCLDETA
jgi:predicted DNA-binding transcriptional regulator AlpA